MYVVQRQRYERWQKGVGTWTHPIDRYSSVNGYEAWEWARERSRRYSETIYQVFEDGKPHGNPYHQGKEVFPTTQGQESEMEYEARKALNIPRDTLVGKLEAKIAEDKAAHDKVVAEAEALVADDITALKKLVKDNPAGLVRLVKDYIATNFFETDSKGEFPNATNRLKSSETAPFVPDPTATKLISVLTAAVDETIEVTPSDDFYRYL